MDISSRIFIHLLDLTRSSCEKYNYRPAIDNSHYRLILKLGKEMQINHHS